MDGAGQSAEIRQWFFHWNQDEKERNSRSDICSIFCWSPVPSKKYRNYVLPAHFPRLVAIFINHFFLSSQIDKGWFSYCNYLLRTAASDRLFFTRRRKSIRWKWEQRFHWVWVTISLSYFLCLSRHSHAVNFRERKRERNKASFDKVERYWLEETSACARAWEKRKNDWEENCEWSRGWPLAGWRSSSTKS